MTGLLVSVRSVAEAEAAFQGGASLIDAKEPRHGSLGRADLDTILAALHCLAGRCPVSAALGELVEDSPPKSMPGLAYAKWGLSQCGQRENWRDRLSGAAQCLEKTNPGCRPVAVAYADWRLAQAPPPLEVFAFARAHRWPAFLIDTWTKDGPTLLEWLTLSEIAVLCARCREAGIQVALAGSLGPREIARLLFTGPDWFAVRGAVCRARNRESEVDGTAVRDLVSLVKQG